MQPNPEVKIAVRYRACDGYRKTTFYKTLAGARRAAQRMVGAAPDIGGNYAVSDDGIGTVYVAGATLRDIFPRSFG